MTRKYSSTSIETTLATGLSSSATTMTVTAGTASSLMGGISLTAGNVDQFTVAIDPDTANEEIVFVTAVASDSLTIVRGRAGSSAITHNGGASVKHVMTSDDLNFYTSGVTTANAAVPQSTATAKGDVLVATASGTVSKISVGTNDYVLTADSTTATGIKWAAGAAGDVTLTGTQTLTNKTLTSPIITIPKTTIGYSAKTAAYTLASGDEGYLFSMNNAATQQFNIPTDATFNFAVGTVVNFVWITGAGQPTIGATTPGTTTVISTGATSATPKLRVANSAASAIKLAANSWLVVGDLA
jgi:hypothetical protein